MKTLLSLLAALSLLLGSSPEPIPAQPTQEQEIATDQEEALPTADELLDRLEEAGADLGTLSADVMYLTLSSLVGEEQRRHGRLYFSQYPSQAEGDEAKRRFAIDFTALYIDDRREEERRSFIFDGRWLVEKLPDERPPQMFKREVVAPGRTFDPLAVGEGPFPIPIGQKREEILRHYTAEFIAPGEGPLEQNTYHIRLHRKPQARDRLNVETLDLWYLRNGLLPVKAHAVDEAGNITEVALANLKPNVELDDALFDTTAPSDEWDVVITAWDDR